MGVILTSSAGKKLARSNVLFLLPGNIIAYSHQIYILSKIFKKKRKPDSRKREINTKMADEIPLTPLFYQT